MKFTKYDDFFCNDFTTECVCNHPDRRYASDRDFKCHTQSLGHRTKMQIIAKGVDQIIDIKMNSYKKVLLEYYHKIKIFEQEKCVFQEKVKKLNAEKFELICENANMKKQLEKKTHAKTSATCPF